VRVGVNKARDNRLAGNVKHSGAGRDAPLCTHALDAVVLDEDIGVLQYFVASHCHTVAPRSRIVPFGVFADSRATAISWTYFSCSFNFFSSFFSSLF